MDTTIKQIGIWMDHAEARFIEPGKPAGNIQTTFSGIETRPRIDGEKPDGTRLGNFRATNNEFNKHAKEQQETHAYFKQIGTLLKPYDEILVFGPTTAQQELCNYLLEHKLVSGKVLHAVKTDYMTENQLVEYVRKHFKEASPKSI